MFCLKFFVWKFPEKKFRWQLQNENLKFKYTAATVIWRREKLPHSVCKQTLLAGLAVDGSSSIVFLFLKNFKLWYFCVSFSLPKSLQGTPMKVVTN